MTITTKNRRQQFTSEQKAELSKKITPIVKRLHQQQKNLMKGIPTISKESLDVFNKQESHSVFLGSRYQAPMHPVDRRELAETKTALIEQKKEGPIPSIYSWKNMNLEIEGEIIKLTATEKLICSFIFNDPSIRAFKLVEIERAVYGEVLFDSGRLMQALKRINGKVREAGFPNIFSWEGGFLSVER